LRPHASSAMSAGRYCAHIDLRSAATITSRRCHDLFVIGFTLVGARSAATWISAIEHAAAASPAAVNRFYSLPGAETLTPR
jgi:hypothetical protein